MFGASSPETTSAQTPALPFELYRAVISFVPPSDSLTLISLAVTSWAFNHEAERRLYRCIVIYEKPSTISKFCAAITLRGRSSFVEELSCLRWLPQHAPGFRDEALSQLGGALKTFVNLHSLGITFGHGVILKDLPPEIQLKSLSMTGLDSPEEGQILTDFVNTQHSLLRLQVYITHFAFELSSQSVTSLGVSLFSLGHALPKFPQVTSLYIADNSKAVLTVDDGVLTRLAQPLSKITTVSMINWKHRPQQISMLAILPFLNNLRTLCIRADINDDDAYDDLKAIHPERIPSPHFHHLQIISMIHARAEDHSTTPVRRWFEEIKTLMRIDFGSRASESLTGTDIVRWDRGKDRAVKVYERSIPEW